MPAARRAGIGRRLQLIAAPSARLPLPTFVIIGAQKSATRWLRTNLGLHPEVFTAPEEPAFFDVHFEQGADHYRRSFQGWSGEHVVGEATPGYMIWRRRPRLVAERMAATVPHARLLAVLRDPVDRAYSAFFHHMKHGRIPPEADFMTTVRARPPEEDRLCLVSGGWYARSLRPFGNRFGDRLQVLLYDDVRRDPGTVYERALRHLGVEPSFRPPGLEEVRFRTPLPQESAHRRRDGSRAPLAPRDREELFEHFAEDVDRLERRFGLDLAAWRP